MKINAGRCFAAALAFVAAAPLQIRAAAAPAADVQPQKKTYAIAPEPLADALAQFAALAGVPLSFETAQLDGLRSVGLNGEYDVREGFDRLLAGSGLQALRLDDGSYVLRRAADGVATLSAVTVQAEVDDVTTEGTGSYAARRATLMKGARSLKDIPQSVTVITRQQMDDQRLDTLDDVLASTPGVTLIARPNGGSDYYARGFMTNTIEYDGVPLLRSASWGNSFSASLVYLDRVEVLRGAQGLLEGAGNPAGAFNLVRKRGLAEAEVRAEARAGSWDDYGGRVEAGRALDAQSRLRSRVVLDYDDSRSWIDTITDRSFNAYGALDYDLGAQTTVGLGLAHSRRDGNRTLYWGVPRYADGSFLNVPRSTCACAEWNDADRRETQAFLDLEHRFGEDWKLKIAGAYVHESYDAVEDNATKAVAVGGSTSAGYGYDYDTGAENLGLDAHLDGGFAAFGIRHEAVLGASYSRQERDDGYSQYITSWDVFDIDHDRPRLDTLEPSSVGTTTSEAVQQGFYGMLRSKLAPPLTLVLGSRLSWYEKETRNAYTTSSSLTRLKASGEFTPYAGVVYALNPQWSVYASYADIFMPQSNTDAQLRTLKPIVGASYEAGVKGELFGGALNASFAAFRIDQKNRAVIDDDASMICGSSGAGYCYRAAGEVRSQGFELEAHGALLPGWQLSGGYTYYRNEYLRDRDSDLVGTRFDYNTPKQLLRLWSDYQLPGRLSPWQLGAGVNVRSELRTNASTTAARQGGYAVWSARAAYAFSERWSASVNVKNVFDKTYYASIYGLGNVFGEPRNLTLTLRGQW
ncbi:MAG: TonB-dependent siderophore receptor [Solimonas sp.]